MCLPLCAIYIMCLFHLVYLLLSLRAPFPVYSIIYSIIYSTFDPAWRITTAALHVANASSMTDHVREQLSRVRDLLDQAVQCLDGQSSSQSSSAQSGRPESDRTARRLGHAILPSSSSHFSSPSASTSSCISTLTERNSLFNFTKRSSGSSSGGHKAKKKRLEKAMWSHEFEFCLVTHLHLLFTTQCYIHYIHFYHSSIIIDREVRNNSLKNANAPAPVCQFFRLSIYCTPCGNNAQMKKTHNEKIHNVK